MAHNHPTSYHREEEEEHRRQETHPHQPPPPQPTNVQHVSHQASHAPPAMAHNHPTSHHREEEEEHRRQETHPHQPPPPQPTHVQHVSHQASHAPPSHQTVPGVQHHGGAGGSGFASNKPTVRIFTKAETNYSLTIKHGQVVLARADPRDENQHWIKDEKWSTEVKDGEGHPSFALVNKATGQAIKHSIASTQPVRLVPYKENEFDESLLWAESKDLGDSYRCIRMVNNIKLNLDALNGDKEHGGVRDGTVAVVWEWLKGDNQRWKIAPY